MVAAPAPCVLLTGFEPFAGDVINPSWEVAKALHGQLVGGVPVVARRLPTAFSQAPGVLHDALQALRPQAIICLGLAASRSTVALERVALNLVDAAIPDNVGAQPVDRPVKAGAPNAYFTRLPLKAIAQALQAEGVSAEVSYSAGTYVCNQVFFELMHALRRRPTARGGFIHLPLLPEQITPQRQAGAMALDQQVWAVRTAIEITLSRADDVDISAGTIG